MQAKVFTSPNIRGNIGKVLEEKLFEDLKLEDEEECKLKLEQPLLIGVYLFDKQDI